MNCAGFFALCSRFDFSSHDVHFPTSADSLELFDLNHPVILLKLSQSDLQTQYSAELKMRVKDIDEYITKSQELLMAAPSSTTISITYTHRNKKEEDTLKSVIRFKTYDAKHGICHVFKTHKIKEFSKLCNALGPRGCNVNGTDMDGISLTLSNAKKEDVVKEEETTPAVESTQKESTPSADSAPSKKKKNKKKGKK